MILKHKVSGPLFPNPVNSPGMQGKYRPLGTASVSIVGQGTWNMERDDPNQAALALQRGIDLNMNHIDTAEMYGSGRVERLVGKAIRSRRDDVFLASKVMPGNASYQGTLKACEASLKRLGTHYLDLYLLHWPGNHPLEETIRAFEELVESGKIRSYSVSNFDVLGLERILDLARSEQDRVQSGALPSWGKNDRAPGPALVRGAGRGGRWIQPVRFRSIPSHR